MYVMRRYGMYAVLAYRNHFPHFGVLSWLRSVCATRFAVHWFA